MIKIHFFDWGCKDLDVEKELKLGTELDEFLVQNIYELAFEATDNEADMDDNVIFYFSGKNEQVLRDEIIKLLDLKIVNSVRMKYTVKIETEN
ncbi:MAG: hypothetical protein K2I93_00085 [Oscillospiraceae bacterium]|nr:hypothetical protein [Oscillospiraceae bacterium]